MPTCAEGHHLVYIWQAPVSLPVLSPFSLTCSLPQDSEAREEEAKMGQQVTKQKYLLLLKMFTTLGLFAKAIKPEISNPFCTQFMMYSRAHFF